MGRIKKYFTAEEKQASRAKASKKYYWNNKEQEDAKARERYRRNLQNNKP